MSTDTAPFDFVGLLGEVCFFKEGQVCSFGLSRKTLALVGYVCANPQVHRRETLAMLLCGSSNDPKGTLRWHLSRIRKTLGDSFFDIQRETVALRWDVEDLDLTRFTRILGDAPEEESEETLCEVLGLYRGEFLRGLSLPDAADFDLWLLAERHRCKLLVEQGWRTLIEKRIARGADQEAISAAHALLRSDPLHEETHGTLMWLYARNGQTEAALAQYRYCEERLRDELGVEPIEETKELLAQIAEGEFRPETGGRAVLGHASRGRGEGQEMQGVQGPEEGYSRLQEPGEGVEQGLFVGRQVEASLLKKALQGDEARLVLVQGHAGLGKTRFVEEMARREGENSFVGACYRSERSVAYHPWVSLFQRWVRELGEAQREEIPEAVWEQVVRLLPAVAFEMGLPPSAPPTAGAEVEHFCAALKFFFSALHGQRTRSCWLFFDDLHWADDASLRLLRYFLRHSQGESLRFLASLDPGAVEQNPALKLWLGDLAREMSLERIELLPLSAEDVTSWIYAVCPELPAATVKDWCHLLEEVTEGNPLHIQELLRAWRAPQHRPDELHRSESLHQLIAQKLASTAQASTQVFEALAIFESPASLRQLQLASGRSEEQVLIALEEHATSHLLLLETAPRELRCHFRNPTVQKAVVSQLSPLRRQLLHRRVASALTQTKGELATIAFHWEEAGENAKAREYALLAAERATRCFALEEALQLFELALARSASPIEQAVVSRRQAEVLHGLAEPDQAKASFAQALESLAAFPSHDERGLCLLAFGRFLLACGDCPAAIDVLEQARDLFLANADTFRVCQTLGEMGRAYRQQGKLQLATACYEQKVQYAHALQEPLKHTTQLLLCEALGALCMIKTQQGHNHAALADFSQMLELIQANQVQEEELLSPGREGGLTLSKLIGASGGFENDNYTQALSFLEAQLEHAGQDSSESARLYRDLSNVSALYAWAGDYERAFSFIHSHLELALNRESLAGLSKVVGNMAELCRYLGAFAEAKACYSYRLALCLDLADRRGTATSLGRLAGILLEQDQLQDAQEPLSLAISLCRASGFLADLASFLHKACDLTHAQDQPSQALTACQEALQLASSQGLHKLAFSARCKECILLNEIGALSDAAAIEALSQLLSQASDEEQRATLHLHLHQLLSLQGSLQEAESHAKQAAQAFRFCYAQDPYFRYAKALHSLTGEDIAQPHDFISLPPIIQNFRRPLPRFYKRARKLIPNPHKPTQAS